MARRRRGGARGDQVKALARNIIKQLPGATKKGIELARQVKPISRGADIARILAPLAGNKSDMILSGADVASNIARATGLGMKKRRRGGAMKLPKVDLQKIIGTVAKADKLARQFRPISTVSNLAGIAAPALGILSPRAGEVLQLGSNIGKQIGSATGYGKYRRRGGMIQGTIHPQQIPGAYRVGAIKF